MLKETLIWAHLTTYSLCAFRASRKKNRESNMHLKKVRYMGKNNSTALKGSKTEYNVYVMLCY